MTWPTISSPADVDPAFSAVKANAEHLVELLDERLSFPVTLSFAGVLTGTAYAWVLALAEMPNVTGEVDPIDLDDPPYELNGGGLVGWREKDAEMRWNHGVMGTMVEPERAYWANRNGLEVLKARRRAGHKNRPQIRALAEHVNQVLYPELAYHWVLLGEQYADQVATLEAMPTQPKTAIPAPTRKPPPSWH